MELGEVYGNQLVETARLRCHQTWRVGSPRTGDNLGQPFIGNQGDSMRL